MGARSLKKAAAALLALGLMRLWTGFDVPSFDEAMAQSTRGQLNTYNNTYIVSNGAGAITGQILDADIGSIITSAGMLAAEASIDALVQHGGPEHVASVMVDGGWVMRDDEILALDETAVIAEAQNQVAALQYRVAAQLPRLMEEMPSMAGRFRNKFV